MKFSPHPQVIESGLSLTVEPADSPNKNSLAMTALAEYRNGGLFVDTGVLRLKDPSDYETLHSAGSELIVEWRALTVVLCDIVKQKLEAKFGQTLKLAQVLEGGTWRAGRIVARKLRPESGGPPIQIRSDGTVF
jgi:hypothetical protein